MNSIFLFVNNIEKEFKPYPYNEFYYVSQDGDVYSVYSDSILTPSIDYSGYPRIDIYLNHIQHHKRVHIMVYETWVGEIPKGFQVNHYDDNKMNMNYLNLYLGTQKDNIADCFRNNHRVGNIASITLYDSILGETITFPSISEFIKYSGHKVANGSISKCKIHKWFNDRYKVISIEGVTTIEQYDQLKENYRKFLIDHNLVEYI